MEDAMAMEVDDRFQIQTDKFFDWLRSRGATISSKIAVKDHRAAGAGRAVVASQDISANEELFKIPRKAVLTVENSDLASKLDDGEMDDLDNWLSLILVMIYELRQGEDSPWKPYFDILPPAFDTLMYWSEEELEELQASAVRGKIGKEEADALFSRHILPIVALTPDVFHGQALYPLTNQGIRDLAHRMGSTIMAYAFDIEKPRSADEADDEGFVDEEEEELLPKGMVPLADLLNADADRNNAKLFYDSEFLIMRALKPIKEGEEILNDYGQLPRSDLLRRYGYVSPEYAKYDVVEISHSLLMDSMKSSAVMDPNTVDSRIPSITDQDLIDDGYDINWPNDDNPTGFSEQLLALLNAFTISDAEFERIIEKGKSFPEKLTGPAAVILSQAVQKRIAEYPTSLEEDNALFVRNKLTGRKKMALDVRIGEKKILQNAGQELNRVIATSHVNKNASKTAEQSANKRRKVA